MIGLTSGTLKEMLRRILSLSILCTSLLFAGVQAEACVSDVPAHDCCPGGPHEPCHESGATGVELAAVQICCVSGVSASSQISTAEPSRELRKQPQRVDPPALPVAIAGAASAHFDGVRSADVPTAPSFDRHLSLLYLSTGRLRL